MSRIPTSESTLSSAMTECRGAVSAIVIFSLCISLLALTVPLYMLHLFDHVLTSRSTDTLVVLTGIAVFALIAFGVLEAARSRIMLAIGTWLDQRLGGAVLAGSIQMAVRTPASGSAQSLRDLATCRTFLTSPGVVSLLDAPWTPIFLVIVFALNATLGWLSLGGAAVLVVLGFAGEFLTRSLLERANAQTVKTDATVDAAVRNADAIEAMGMMPGLIARWVRHNAGTVALQVRAGARSSTIVAISKVARSAIQVAMLAFGAWLTLKGEITPGVTIAASILMTRALSPVEQAIGSYRSMVAAWIAYRRLDRHLRTAPSRGNGMTLPAPLGRLSAESVLYAHPGSTEPLLRGVSFAVEPGEVLGLIGPAGSGKSTLARLLVGNLRPNAGHVRLDDADIAAWDSDDRGRYFGYLPRESDLFAGTVRDNISRFTDGAPEAVIEAARLAGVHELVLRLPQGYETDLLDRGVNLSGSERHRIALARALYGQPRLVVLDEPNASLDAVGEEALLAVIDRLRERKITTVVIAHWPNILRHVDRIVVMRNGQIEMMGPRAEILRRVTRPEPALRDVAAVGGHG